MAETAGSRVVVGRVAGIFGVKGWVRVFSYTDPPGNILEYGPWLVGPDQGRRFRLTEGAVHGKGIIAHLEGVDDRDAARALIGASIAVSREALGEAGDGSFFWSDLVGLKVVNEQGEDLGVVTDLLETGANDVLVLKGERRRLVPFVNGTVVKSVDLAGGVVTVDWDREF